jgi:hypothetical protein
METNVRWATIRTGGTTLVSVVLWSERPRTVRVRPTVDGPVWPPRRRGVPSEGWTDGEFTGTVDGRLAVGFATHASAGVPASSNTSDLSDEEDEVCRGEERDGDTHRGSADPELDADANADVDAPVEVTWLGPAELDGPADPALDVDVPRVEATVPGVRRALGDPRPPRDAVPPVAPSLTSSERRDASRDPPPATERGAPDPGSEVRPYLVCAERRIETGEALAAAATLDAATEAVERAGGLDAVRALPRVIERDAERLARLERRAEMLRERAEHVTVPVETMERLA